jgi:hypothetical protein
MPVRPAWLLIGAFAPHAISAQQPVTIPAAVRAAAEAITAAGLGSDVAYLASDALRGRGTPSPGLDSAAAFVVRRLTALGLQPAGDDGTYLQHYVVRDVTLDTSATYIEVGGRRFRYGDDFIVAAFGDSTTIAAPLAWVGHGIRAPAKGIDPYAGVDVRGRIIVANGPGVFPPGETYESLGAVFTDWQTPGEVASERGAPASLLIPPARLLRRWNAFRRDDLLHNRELTPPVPSSWTGPALPMLWLQPAVARALLAAVRGGSEALLARADSGDFVPSFALPADQKVTIHIAVRSETRIEPSNVVAMIPGSDPALRGEVVTLGAHLDGAVDAPIRPGATDSVFNAADDNASGSTSILSVAAAMMRAPRPRRSVVFLWDSGEETGLWGSKYFVAHPPVPLEGIVAHFNIDMIGRSKAPGTAIEGQENLAGPDEIYVVGPRVLSSDVDSLLEQANRAYLNVRLSHRFDDANHEYFYPRTDAAPLLEHGVLSIGFQVGEHEDYHMPTDEADRLDLAKLERVSRTIFVSAWLLADLPARPRLDKGIPLTVRRYR